MAGLNLPQPTALEAGEGKQALEEAAAIAVGADLSDRKQLNEINALFRADRRDTHLYRVTVCGLWVAGTAILIMFLVLVAHKTLPVGMRFLDPDEIQRLTEFLFSGVVGGFVAKGGEVFLRK